MQIITLMALMLHAHLGEDCFGIYEVGMGGRYDSTNVFTRSTVGLCTISEDHLEEFGGSLVALAQEKVALCSAGSTLFSQVQVEPALAVIEEYCRRQGIQRHTVSMVSEFRVRYCLPTWFLSNMALAWNLATHLCPERESKDVPPDLFAKRLPRRFEERDIYGRSFLLDGAHNQRAVEALLAHLNNEKSSRPKSMVAIVGFSVSKNWMPLLRQIVLSPLFKEIAFTQATRPRGVEPNHLVDEASDTYRCRGFASLKSTLDWAFNSEHRQFVIFGSLLLAADFDKALHALGLGHFAVDAEEIDPQQPWMHPLL
jgi:folylpolyglutamate synthase/dihydropteroate synthase